MIIRPQSRKISNLADGDKSANKSTDPPTPISAFLFRMYKHVRLKV